MHFTIRDIQIKIIQLTSIYLFFGFSLLSESCGDGEGETTDDSNYMTSSDRELPPGSAVPPLNLPNSPTPQSSSQSTPSMTRHNMVLPIYLYHCTKKQIIDCLINNSTDNVKKDEYIVSISISNILFIQEKLP